MVLEISPAILGPLPLPRHPKSKPFTPCAVVSPGYVIPPPGTVASVTQDLAMRLYARELRVTLDLISSFSTEDWAQRTDCPDWDVHGLYLHVLGAMESGASTRELLHQMRVALLRRRTTGEALEAALSATQVADRTDLTPDQLVRRFALPGRRDLPARRLVAPRAAGTGLLATVVPF